MFYTIYKTTNLINGKFYIGKHKTKDLNDGYLGSGKLLKRAIDKYGVNNFHKEILHICRDEKHMNLLECILVVPDDETNYNLCEGGKGGWSFINRTGRNKKFTKEEQIKGSITLSSKWKNDNIWAEKQRQRLLPHLDTIRKTAFAGKTHTDEWRQNHSAMMKEKQNGKLNSQYGTCWITNGVENKKIKKEELDSWTKLGYNKGRIKGR